MKILKINLYSFFISFLLLAVSGFILLIIFHDNPEVVFLGMEKSVLIEIHAISALVNIINLFWHLYIKRLWIGTLLQSFFSSGEEKKPPINKVINTMLMGGFLLTAITGIIPYFSDIKCLLCEGFHDKFGILLLIILIVHLWDHKFPKKYLNK